LFPCQSPHTSLVIVLVPRFTLRCRFSMGCSSSVSANYLGEIVSPVREPKLIQANFVRNEDGPLGLRLQHNSRGVIVQGVESDGTVSAWNAQHPSMQVSFGDRLVAVNGIKVDPSWTCWCSILLELRKHTVTIVVTRARAEDLLRLSLPPRADEALDHLLPRNFLDSMEKHTAAECDVVECCICLEELEPDTTVVQLPCKHAFHRGCAEKWLTRCPTFRFAKCPMCRQQLGTPPAVYPEVLDANGTPTVAVRQA